MLKKREKEKTLDEKLDKIKPELFYKGKKVGWKDIKEKTIEEIQSSPDFEGELPRLWQENMKHGELYRR
ncbi:MAG: hypothetical protein DDT22_00904 [candidate division WS2 bacterium]|nr:hypothetical protein [Candidatus Lithacetigena glycinireducens]